jgi:hypothetical protein
MTTRSRLLAAGLLLPALLLAACDTDTPDAMPPDEETGTGSDMPFTGSDVGYITAVYEPADGELPTIDVDLIEWYSGADAAAAAKQDDPDCPGDCVPPNGYYVRNTEKSPFGFEVANDVRVFAQTADDSEEELTFDQFLRRLVSNGRIADAFRSVPFWIEHEDGVITEIREQKV